MTRPPRVSMESPSPFFKIQNDYARALGTFYDDTPKAVFAALAYAFADRLFGPFREDPAGAAGAVKAMLNEWATLHASGIVPQAPPEGRR